MSDEGKATLGRGSHPNSRANLRPIQPGEVRNPSGRPRQVATKLLREMSVAQAEGAGDGETRLSRIVNQLLSKAEGGDLDAIKIVLDRLEGRPRQSVSLDVGERERYERMVENMIESEAAEGRELTREQAIAALATVSPEIEEVLT
jgi:hypothetical protein